MSGDLVAARVHERRELEHLDAADRFRRLGLHVQERAALRAAEREAQLAARLRGPKGGAA